MVLAEEVWRSRRAAHERGIDAFLAEHLERRAAGRKHPVADFLFTYYTHRPAQLRRWHPGAGVALAGADPAELGPEYVAVPGGATLDVARILDRRGDSVRWISELLTATAGRAPHFGCFG